VRQAKEAEREQKAQQREAAAAARQRQQVLETGMRSATRIITSREGQSMIRGVFSTIFGSGKGR